MAYYIADYENFAADSWYEPNLSAYLTWTPGMEYAAANTASFAAGQANATNNGGTGHYGAAVFVAQATAAFSQNGSFGGMKNGRFIGVTIGRLAFGTTADDQGQVLIYNEEEVKQDGQPFHLPRWHQPMPPCPTDRACYRK
jgi:hypothetical protein